MEKTFKLKAFDGKQIECILNTGKRKNSVVTVFVHGLTGHPNEHLFFNAAKLFPENGTDTVRVALYGDGEDQRTLADCGISTHAKDIERVLNYLRPKYTTVAVVGHSLGSPTILLADKTQMDIVVLWEPSYLSKERKDDFKVLRLSDRTVFVLGWGFDFRMRKKMIKEWQEFDSEKELKKVSRLDKPLLIIGAQKGILVDGCKKYFEAAQEPKKLKIIEKATHCFDELGTEEEVHKATLDWILKHSK